jgi:hypothetical protein
MLSERHENFPSFRKFKCLFLQIHEKLWRLQVSPINFSGHQQTCIYSELTNFYYLPQQFRRNISSHSEITFLSHDPSHLSHITLFHQIHDDFNTRTGKEKRRRKGSQFKCEMLCNFFSLSNSIRWDIKICFSREVIRGVWHFFVVAFLRCQI